MFQWIFLKTFYFICTSLFQKGKGEVSSTVQSFNCLNDAFNYVRGQEKLWHDSKNNLIEFKYNPEKETLFAAYENEHYKCAYVLTKQYLFADEKCLEEKTDWVLNNPAAFNEKEIRKTAEQFRFSKVGKQLEGIYCKVIEG